MRRESLIEMKVEPKEENNAQDNTLKAYLREIADYPQLSQEEEIELAKRIEQGDLAAK